MKLPPYSSSPVELDSKVRQRLLEVPDVMGFLNTKRGEFVLVSRFFDRAGLRRLVFELTRNGLVGSDERREVLAKLRDRDFDPSTLVFRNVYFRHTPRLGHKIDPVRFTDDVSKSQRVTDGIDIIRKGEEPMDEEKRIVYRLYVKYTSGKEEGDRAVKSAGRRWSSKRFTIKKQLTPQDAEILWPSEQVRAVMGEQIKGGLVVEERHPDRTSIRLVGNHLDENGACVFATAVAGATRDMLDLGLIFNYERYGNTHVRALLQGNRVYPFYLNTPLGQNRWADSQRADTISDLIRRIRDCNLRDPKNNALTHHLGVDDEHPTGRWNHFADWVGRAVGDKELASRLHAVRYNPDDPEHTRRELMYLLESGIYDAKYVGVDSYIERPADPNEWTDIVTNQVRHILFMFSNIGASIRPIAWRRFEDEFKGEPSTDPTAMSQEMIDYTQRCQIFDRVRSSMLDTTAEGQTDEYAQEYWVAFFDSVGQKVPLQSPASEADHELLTLSLEQLKIPRKIGREIAWDVALKGKGRVPPIEARNLLFSASDSDGGRLVQAYDSENNPVMRYLIKRVDPSEKENYAIAAGEGLGPKLIDTEDSECVVMEYNNMPLETIALPQCSRFGVGLARAVSRGYRRGFLPSNMDARSVIAVEDEGGVKVLFTDWSKLIKFPDQKSPERHQAIVEHLAKNMDFIHAVPSPDLAFKSMEQELLWSRARDKKEAKVIQTLLKDLKTALGERPAWTDLMAAARKAILINERFRRVQSRWLKTLRETDPLTNYHPDTQKKIESLYDPIHEGLKQLFEEGFFKDVAADARHMHIYVPGGPSTVIDAKTGAVDVSEGFFLFELYDLEEDKSRYLKNMFKIPFKDGKIGGYELIDKEDLERLKRTHVSPAAFKIHLRVYQDGERLIGDQKYGFQPPERLFTACEDIETLRQATGGRTLKEAGLSNYRAGREALNALRKQVMVEDSWEFALNRIVLEFVDWYGVIKHILDKRDTIEVDPIHGNDGPELKRKADIEARRRFMVECAVRLDPANTEFLLDGRIPALDHSPTKTPELVDFKARRYPHLDERISFLTTLESAMPLVYEHEKNQLGYRMSESEQTAFLQNLVAGGDFEWVKLRSKVPHEYILGIQYLQDKRHYTVALKVATEKGDRSVVLKNTDQLGEIIPATILMNIRGPDGNPLIRVPHIVAMDPGFSCMTLMEGMKLGEAGSLVGPYSEKLAFEFGAHAHLKFGEGHPGNFLITTDGKLTRLDLEHIPNFETIRRQSLANLGVSGLDERVQTLACYPVWNEIMMMRYVIPDFAERRGVYWAKFQEGMRYADPQVKASAPTIMGLVERLNGSYPVSRTKLDDMFLKQIMLTLDAPCEEVLKAIPRYAANLYEGLGRNISPQYLEDAEFWRAQTA
ncbi:MAG: hypothetical protein V1875_09700 [Candidatus Altiarchaeota archaeon]